MTARKKTRFLAAFPLVSLILGLPAGEAFAIFTLSVSPGGVAFGPLNVGTSSPVRTLTIQVQSDDPSTWDLLIDAAPLTHADMTTSFPAANHLYRFNNDLPGSEIPPAPAEASVPAVATAIYQGQPTECASAACSIELAFRVAVPPAQKTGSYSTVLNVTLMTSF